jgi:3-methyl-2-oxobutanoate hydroxymethyltransferase
MNERKPLSLPRLQDMHARGEKIAMLTAYDASFARLYDECGVDVILVGDSLGNVIQGRNGTTPVTLDQMVYHVEAVARGSHLAWLVGDLPFGSYQESAEQAMRSAVRLVQAGAQMVKLEGGGWTAEAVRFIVERGVPVCAHLGLTPQTVHALGGHRIQGRDADGAETLLRQATELADAGATLLVLELVPSALANRVTEAISIPTIGIGAGPGTSGQVLVMHDLLGITRGRVPRFVRNFMDGTGSVEAAVRAYVQAVKDGSFPDPVAHGY